MTAETTPDAPEAVPYAHLRPADDHADVPAGVYRVVGTGDPVALLQVGDADGARVTTGDLRRVARADLAGFEPAADPDASRSLAARLRSRLTGVAWEFRVLGGAIRDRPVVGLALLGLVVVGLVGDRFLDAPDLAFAAATFVGAFGLVLLAQRG